MTLQEAKAQNDDDTTRRHKRKTMKGALTCDPGICIFFARSKLYNTTEKKSPVKPINKKKKRKDTLKIITSRITNMPQPPSEGH